MTLLQTRGLDGGDNYWCVFVNATAARLQRNDVTSVIVSRSLSAPVNADQSFANSFIYNFRRFNHYSLIIQ